MMIPKFRAWLIGQEYMAEIEAIAFRGDGNVDVYTSLSGNDFYTVGEECELMQSIGLHDKNGVEIFADDIVEINLQSIIDNSIKKQLCAVIFNDGCFMLKSLSKIELPWVADSRISMNDDVCIVGNLHENPELLEQ